VQLFIFSLCKSYFVGSFLPVGLIPYIKHVIAHTEGKK